MFQTQLLIFFPSTAFDSRLPFYKSREHENESGTETKFNFPFFSRTSLGVDDSKAPNDLWHKSI